MIPSQEERQIRPCNTCSRYIVENIGSEKCMKGLIGPVNSSLNGMRDAFDITDLIEWPCKSHLTHDEFKECVRTKGFFECKAI